MAVTVIPGQLDFYKGLTDAEQILGVTVTGENVIISVPAAPAGDFSWDPSPAAGWELRKPAGSGGVVPAEALAPPTLVIRVRFNPSSTNEVHGTLTVNATQNDVARTPIPNFPLSVPLRGNLAGVGPGMLKITDVNANPVGPDLGPGPDQEFVEIINISGSELDLDGCRVGDMVIGVQHGGERNLLRFTNTFTLAPVGGAVNPTRLRIYTGKAEGVPADPSIDPIALNRGSPVWNNAGDIAWIRNASGQYVDRFSTFPALFRRRFESDDADDNPPNDVNGDDYVSGSSHHRVHVHRDYGRGGRPPLVLRFRTNLDIPRPREEHRARRYEPMASRARMGPRRRAALQPHRADREREPLLHRAGQ